MHFRKCSKRIRWVDRWQFTSNNFCFIQHQTWHFIVASCFQFHSAIVIPFRSDDDIDESLVSLVNKLNHERNRSCDSVLSRKTFGTY